MRNPDVRFNALKYGSLFYITNRISFKYRILRIRLIHQILTQGF